MKDTYKAPDLTQFTDWEESYKLILEHWGFPSDTIITEYKLENNRTADIVININQPLAVIEIKKGKVDLKVCAQVLNEIIKNFKVDIEGYLFVIDNPKFPGDKPVKYYKLNQKNQKLEEIDYFPNYGYFKSLKTKKILNELYVSDKIFNYISIGFGILLIIYYFIITYIGFEPKTNQLFVLFAGLVGIILPFFSKIKIAGIELARIPEGEKSKTTDK